VTPDGCVANGLPATYPRTATGEVVSWDVCRPVGRRSWDEGLPGIACRSAAEGAPPDGEELAWFDRRPGELVPAGRQDFSEWYGAVDW
jgi:hypothetical protein